MVKIARFLGLWFLLSGVGLATSAQAAVLLASAPMLPHPPVHTILPIADQLQQLMTGTVPATSAAPAAEPVGSAAPTPMPSLLTPSVTVPGILPLSSATVPPLKSDEDLAEPQETFGTRALGFAIADLDYLREQSKNFIDNFSAWQDLTDWLALQQSDARHQQFWLGVARDMPKIIGIPLLVAIAIDLLFLPLVRGLIRRQPERLAHRLALILSLYAIKLAPLLVFLVASLSLLDKYETHKTARFVILNIVYALAVGRFVLLTWRVMLAPMVPGLRFAPISNGQAIYAYRSLRAFSLVIVCGYFLLDVARAVRMPLSTIGIAADLLGLVLVVMAIAVIAQKRAFVAHLLRGNLSAAQPNLSSWQSLRLWFARNWHGLAITYLVIGYGVTSLGVENGLTLMLRGTIVSLSALFAIRFLFKAIDRWSLIPNAASGSPWLHRSILQIILHPLLWVLAVLTAAAGWGVDVGGLFAQPWGQRVLGSAFSLGITLFILTALFELFNYACDRHLNRVDDMGNPAPVSSRTRTLLPMLRHTVFIFFFGIVVLMALSETGINIKPLLAGAGVVGVAIGFGSQTLIKDFLTGLFIVLEDTIAIGDVVQVGTHSGVVEAMSVRTLRLRDENGALHILPFSEVSQIINMTKDFAYAVIDMSVAYDSDLKHVMEVIRAEGEELQKDPIFKRVILEPIEILGIEKLGDSSITIRSRIRTRAGKQWDIKRLMLLNLKARFEAEKIEIPFPTVMHLQRFENPATAAPDLEPPSG